MTRPLPLGVRRPQPVWAFDADANLERRQRIAHEDIARQIVAKLVVKHPAPWLGDPVTSSALSLKALAEAKGMRTAMNVGLDYVIVEGRVGEQRLGFRARWTRGKADVALWHEPEARWGMMHDTRPVGVSERDKVGLAKHRTSGLDEHHLVQLASPAGMPVAFAELTKRVKALP